LGNTDNDNLSKLPIVKFDINLKKNYSLYYQSLKTIGDINGFNGLKIDSYHILQLKRNLNRAAKTKKIIKKILE
jgi:hypothetical protein